MCVCVCVCVYIVLSFVLLEKKNFFVEGRKSDITFNLVKKRKMVGKRTE